MVLRRRFLAGAVGLSAVFAVIGCEPISEDRDRDDIELPQAAARVGGNEVWDLRRRPTAERVGIRAGEDTAVYETRPARPVVLRLPAGAEARLSARYLAFSSILSEDGDPVTLDVKSPMMPLGDTVTGYRSVLEQLGLPTGTVAEFRDAAQGATGSERVLADRVAERFGDLEIGVVARYSPHSKTGVVALSGGWGR